MNKKWDENVTVVSVEQPPLEQNAGPIDTSNFTTNSGSVVVPFEDYLKTVDLEQIKLLKTHNAAGFPDLFEIRGLENDKESTVPALAMSRPVKIFTALYEAKYKLLMKQAKTKVPN